MSAGRKQGWVAEGVGEAGGFRRGDIWYTIQPSPEAATASGACGHEG